LTLADESPVPDAQARPALQPRSAAVALEGSGGWSSAALVSTDGNRWSRAGEPTIYLAGDVAVALGEFARHMPLDPSPRVGSLWSVSLDLERVVDLRRADVPRELSLPAGSSWILDADRCRDVSATLRRADVTALLVPSAAFLDRPDRFNIVIFADRLHGHLDDRIREPRRVAILRPS
jgi:RES domain-containing protein